jgi:hypothetical protein
VRGAIREGRPYRVQVAVHGTRMIPKQKATPNELIVTHVAARQYVECMRSAAKLSRGMANVHRLRNGKSQ